MRITSVHTLEYKHSDFGLRALDKVDLNAFVDSFLCKRA